MSSRGSPSLGLTPRGRPKTRPTRGVRHRGHNRAYESRVANPRDTQPKIDLCSLFLQNRQNNPNHWPQVLSQISTSLPTRQYCECTPSDASLPEVSIDMGHETSDATKNHKSRKTIFLHFSTFSKKNTLGLL